jgi:hypothetical protein
MLKILILAHSFDFTAIRIYARLRKKYTNEYIQLVTAESFAMSPYWVHQLVDTSAPSLPETIIHLADGNRLQIDNETVIFNRIHFAPMLHFANSEEVDQHYAEMEMTALWLSWLQSLSDQLINKPSPRNLAGAGFSRAEWIANAMKVGISSVIFEQDSQLELQNLFLPSISMLLIGKSFELDPNSTNISDDELRGITALTTRIQQFSGCQYLRTYFNFQDGEWRFNHGDPLADPVTDQQVQSIIKFLEDKAGFP